MARKIALNTKDLQNYNKVFDTNYEDIAFEARGEFLRLFPRSRLQNIKLDDYVIGLKRPTFCFYVEVKTRPWANIQGATAFKFGIFFGKTGDSERAYRFTKKFGISRDQAFLNVKESLLALVRLGSALNLDFDAIDANPLSQMFKAKILSLYFPEQFLNVCSGTHLVDLGDIFGLPENLPLSEYQHRLLLLKQTNSVSKDWSNPKFMSFLYDTYMREEGVTDGEQTAKAPRRQSNRIVDFDELNAQREKIGKAAEAFALEWEKRRLVGCDLGHVASRIGDMRDRPGFGFDFLSFSSPHIRRYIEVKSVGKLPGGEGFRFFLSANEHGVSKSSTHRDEYFFYMVFFDGKGSPMKLTPTRASEFYEVCELQSNSFVARFDI